jgi:RNA polymerase-binding transcription factor DksA
MAIQDVISKMRDLGQAARDKEAETVDELNKAIYKMQGDTYNECAEMIEIDLNAAPAEAAV